VKFGICQKDVEGGGDGCHAFMPSLSNSMKCGCCSYHVGFHKPIVATPPTLTTEPTVCGEDTANNQILEFQMESEPNLKRPKLSHDHEDLEKELREVKLEFPTSIESKLEKTRNDQSMDPRLVKNWTSLRTSATFSFEKVGEYFPMRSEKAKHKGKWMMWCMPYGMKYASIQPSMCLNNFMTHLSPKPDGVATVHETHLQNRLKDKIKIGALEAEKLASMLKKRSTWMLKWAFEGMCSLTVNFPKTDTF
jgi:hypothetical protein